LKQNCLEVLKLLSSGVFSLSSLLQPAECPEGGIQSSPATRAILNATLSKLVRRSAPRGIDGGSQGDIPTQIWSKSVDKYGTCNQN